MSQHNLASFFRLTKQHNTSRTCFFKCHLSPMFGFDFIKASVFLGSPWARKSAVDPEVEERERRAAREIALLARNPSWATPQAPVDLLLRHLWLEDSIRAFILSAGKPTVLELVRWVESMPLVALQDGLRAHGGDDADPMRIAELADRLKESLRRVRENWDDDDYPEDGSGLKTEEKNSTSHPSTPSRTPARHAGGKAPRPWGSFFDPTSPLLKFQRPSTLFKGDDVKLSAFARLRRSVALKRTTKLADLRVAGGGAGSPGTAGTAGSAGGGHAEGAGGGLGVAKGLRRGGGPGAAGRRVTAELEVLEKIVRRGHTLPPEQKAHVADLAADWQKRHVRALCFLFLFLFLLL